MCCISPRPSSWQNFKQPLREMVTTLRPLEVLFIVLWALSCCAKGPQQVLGVSAYSRPTRALQARGVWDQLGQVGQQPRAPPLDGPSALHGPCLDPLVQRVWDGRGLRGHGLQQDPGRCCAYAISRVTAAFPFAKQVRKLLPPRTPTCVSSAVARVLRGLSPAHGHFDPHPVWVPFGGRGTLTRPGGRH